MGGEREKILETPETRVAKGGKGGAATVEQGGRSIRVHEYKGQVHFHDDIGQLKCAVKVSEWWKVWERLKTATPEEPQSWSYADTINNTALRITIAFSLTELGELIDADIDLRPIKVGLNFKQLDDFTRV